MLFFDDRHYAAQGAQKLLVQLASLAQDAGIDATVGCTKDGPFLEHARQAGLPVAVFGVPARLDKFEGALVHRGSVLPTVLALWKQNRSLSRQVEADGYDLVWAAALRSLLSLVRTRVMGRVPVVWQIMGSARFPVLSEVASLLATRIVVIAEGLRPTVGVLADLPFVRRKIRVVQTGLPVPTDLGSTRQQVREDLGLPESAADKVWLMSLGAHIPDKGHLDVVHAFLALPEPTRGRAMLLVGGPPLEGTYREELLAAANGSDQIRVFGWVDNVDAWLRAADVYILASRREGMPLTLIEAMQRRVTAVGYPVGGVPELIEDGRTGRLVPTGDVDALCQALQSLIDDEDARRLLADRGHEHVLANNTDRVMAAKFRAVTDELIPQSRQVNSE